jgi:hypothetical protein
MAVDADADAACAAAGAANVAAGQLPPSNPSDTQCGQGPTSPAVHQPATVMQPGGAGPSSSC